MKPTGAMTWLEDDYAVHGQLTRMLCMDNLQECYSVYCVGLGCTDLSGQESSIQFMFSNVVESDILRGIVLPVRGYAISLKTTLNCVEDPHIVSSVIRASSPMR
jgi:hypothetical protein